MATTEDRIWRAQPRQREFLRRTEHEVLYGGAAGGGKTDALLIHGIRVCTKHAGARVMFLRRTFADLDKPGAAIDRSRALLTGIADWNGGQHRWTFGNDSILQFGHLQNPGDVYNYQGAQFDALLWDELTQFTEEQYDFLSSRVRATVEGIQTTIRAATNPGGVGHGWVKTRWIEAGPWGEPFTRRNAQTGLETTACFVPAKVDDNQELLRRDPTYKARLAGLPENLRRAYLEGDWDTFVGQVFREWRRDIHVCTPFEIPAEWPRWRGVDYGYNAPFCCLWLARSPEDKRVYVYRELYQRELRDLEQAARIYQLTGLDRILATFADPSMWNTQPNGTTIAGAYATGGVLLSKANNDRKTGWQRVHEYLYHDERTKPRLQVFETCMNLIRTLPALVYDEHQVEDVNTDGDDHAADALRYGLMGGVPLQADDGRRVVKGRYG